jgi:Zinc dependent phospholipase C
MIIRDLWGAERSWRVNRHLKTIAIVLIVAAMLLVVPREGTAFSVLAHQAIVDEAWRETLLPLLRTRFPNASEDELRDALAYAHGGSHLPDLGYFPFGSHLFSDLLHYVRTGDFNSRLLAEAESPNEYAFALGMLAHYEADANGHPEATNLAVPIIYPKLENKYGNRVTYADSPSAHLETEFRFDVLQVAHRHDIPGFLDHAVEFKVPEQFLDRVFRETYGLDLADLFVSYDVGINTYRWGFRTLVNEGTGIAWQLYRQNIQSLEPGITSKQFVRPMSRAEFTQQFGKAFLEPGYFAQFVGFMGNLVPNIGPFKRLPYKPLPLGVQQLYFRAFHNAYQEYVREVGAVANHKAWLMNLNLDTGLIVRAGEYQPADKAYVELLHLHAKDHFARMPSALARNLLEHFQNPDVALACEPNQQEREKTLNEVSELAGRTALTDN